MALLSGLIPLQASALMITEVFYNATGADDGYEWIEIYNPGAAIDLSSYSLGWGGADYTTGTLQLSGIIGAGQTFVVGGPISDASNGNPIFDQIADFNPDLENSGFLFAAADGIALFDVIATAITATTVPIDAFIYGGTFFSTNSNGLIDETGAVGTIDYTAPFASAGTSAEFDGTTWTTQAAPTPGILPPLVIPEPSTAILMGLGLIGLAWASGKR